LEFTQGCLLENFKNESNVDSYVYANQADGIWQLPRKILQYTSKNSHTRNKDICLELACPPTLYCKRFWDYHCKICSVQFSKTHEVKQTM